jgi:hypothetical protein
MDPTGLEVWSSIKETIMSLDDKVSALKATAQKDETRAQSLWRRYWPALAALVVGLVVGHFV